ncbi:MAG: hypothetical protein WBC95_06165 [Albidovulum sp.]
MPQFGTKQRMPVRTQTGPALVVVGDAHDRLIGPALLSEIRAMPMVFGTAHNLVVRGNIGRSSRVAVLFAGEREGYAALRLAANLGGVTSGLCLPENAALVRAAGAAFVGADEPLPNCTFDSVIDLIGGQAWRQRLAALKPGGIYVTPGVIPDPKAPGEIRNVHLNDLSLDDRPHYPREVFPGMVTTVAASHLRALPEIRPYWSELK